MEQQAINNEVNNAVTALIDQFAEIKFEGMVMYVVLIVVALIICFEGYQIYRMALLLIGFVVGYTQAHYFLDFIHYNAQGEMKLMIQAVIGVICAIISSTAVRVGVFFSAYYFAKYALAVPIANFVMGIIEKKVTIPGFLIPVITSAIGLLAAYLIAKLAVDSLRPVIVILTAAVGGFSLVNGFIGMIPFFPYDLSFMPGEGSIIWVAAKLFMTGAGVGIQGIKDIELLS
ncbi:MAG: DUF4203 domain-containing protein [Lachnospiraceae bacterium]|nr:DUF4203 domain-containing protein [Lachnospiraceae bacterium]